MKIQWRKNVLLLVLSGYVVLLIIFLSMMWPGNLAAKDAYDVLEGPLMALIGGSLALAKDLIDDPTDPGDAAGSSDGGDQEANQQQIHGQDEGARQ